jgi:hypothetical protein
VGADVVDGRVLAVLVEKQSEVLSQNLLADGLRLRSHFRSLADNVPETLKPLVVHVNFL